MNQARLGGVYAQPSNIGSYNRNELSAIPEVGVNVGCQLTAHLRALVGYSFLYIAEVVRPGDQIDRTVNLTQQNAGGLVGAARPQFAFNALDFRRKALVSVWNFVTKDRPGIQCLRARFAGYRAKRANGFQGHVDPF